MYRVKTLSTLPSNFPLFREEIAVGLGRLYGAAGAEEYRQNARRAVSANLVHPQVRALALYDGKTVVGILMAIVRNGGAEIFFIHLLACYQGKGLEGRLIREGVRILRKEGVAKIVSECVVMGNLDLDGPFLEAGFEAIHRQLMAADLAAPALTGPSPLPVKVLERDDWARAAQCIVAAYAGHPGARLHGEVQSVSTALDFLARVEKGGYGLSLPAYSLALWSGGACAGVTVGCQAAPTAGFVLQIVVSPEFQQRGYATALLLHQVESFRRAGYDRVLLGVTCDNPARRLYEKLGFAVIQPVTAYVWWQE